MGLDSFKTESSSRKGIGGRPENSHDISDRQMDILTGMVASDSSLGKQSYGNPFIITHMTNPIYMSWLDNQLGELSTGLENSTSGKSDWSVKDRYTLRTSRDPKLEKFDWVEDGEKVIPESIRFNSLVAKVWYAGDGSMLWNNSHDSKRACFASASEHNRSIIKSKLESKEFNPSINGNRVDILCEETDEFIEWLGKPVPGYGYKWETDSYQDYVLKKDLMP